MSKSNYVFSIEYNKYDITGESLYWYPKGRPVRVYDRDLLATQYQLEEVIGPAFRTKETFSFAYYKIPNNELYLNKLSEFLFRQ